MTITIELEEIPFVLEQLIAEQTYMANGIAPIWVPLEDW